MHPQSQIPSKLPPQNVDQKKYTEQMGIKLKYIPPEYKEKYKR